MYVYNYEKKYMYIFCSQALLIHSECVPRPQWDPGNADGSNSCILWPFVHNTYKLARIKN